MDWQTPEDTVPSAFITEANARSVIGKPPASGAWRDGDQPGDRQFVSIGALELERGATLPSVRIAYESWGELNADGSNAVLVLHALTGDSHVLGGPGPSHPTAGWWSGNVGPGKPIDTDRWYVVAPNMLGGCQGSTGPASTAPDGAEWGSFSVRHYPRPGRGADSLLRPSRHRPLGRDRRWLDGRDAGPRVGGRGTGAC